MEIFAVEVVALTVAAVGLVASTNSTAVVVLP